MNILLVSPRTPETFWSFRHALSFISKHAHSPPLGLLTIAALMPRSWNFRLKDLDVSKLSDRDILWADYVLLSGMIVHRESIHEIAARCHDLDRTVIGGGPIFTSDHEQFPDVPHCVLGEAEDLIPELVADMTSGNVKPLYQAEDRPDVTQSPVPRWDLVDFRHYASASIQFCRGCPFDCEFCDVIVMNGRRPRTKTPEQIIRELESLRTAGWKGHVFFVDDNFLGNKHRVRELLPAVIDWRKRSGARMDFLTEASVNLADEPELLGLMVDAGFKKVFVGIETPILENLEACRKLQNIKRDLVESVKKIQSAGLEVMGGFIIGFDGDTPDVFQRQFDFIQRAGVVTAMVGLLTAVPKTRLYERLRSEGRLLAESTGNNTEATLNFVTHLNRDDLIVGYRRLMQRLYEPRVYYDRARALLRTYRHRGPQPHMGWLEIRAFLRSMWQLGVRRRGRRAYWGFLGHTIIRNPGAFSVAVTLAIYGHHFRVVSEKL